MSSFHVRFEHCLAIGMILLFLIHLGLIYNVNKATTIDYSANIGGSTVSNNILPPHEELSSEWTPKGIEGSNRNYISIKAKVNCSNMFEHRQADLQTETWILKQESNYTYEGNIYLVISKISVESSYLPLAGISYTLRICNISENNVVGIRDWSTGCGSANEYQFDCQAWIMGFLSPKFMLPPLRFEGPITESSVHGGKCRVTYRWKFNKAVKSSYRYEIYCAFYIQEISDEDVSPYFELKTDTTVTFIGTLGYKYLVHTSSSLGP